MSTSLIDGRFRGLARNAQLYRSMGISNPIRSTMDVADSTLGWYRIRTRIPVVVGEARKVRNPLRFLTFLLMKADSMTPNTLSDG
jgi:hypothetical protein